MTNNKSQKKVAVPKGKQGWRRKAAAKLRVLFAGSTLVLAGAACAGVTPPPEVGAEAGRAKQDNLENLKNQFGRTQLGRDLLQFARREKIEIRYEADNDPDGMGGYQAGVVKLDTGFVQEVQVMVLGHELRHAWQEKVLKSQEYREKRLTPTQRWTLMRYIEADACAFTTYLWADRMARLRMNWTPAAVGTSMVSEALELRNEMRSWDGVTRNEYHDIALRSCFEAIAHHYNRDHANDAIDAEHRLKADIVALARKIDNNELDAARVMIDRLQKEFREAPDDKEFDGYLRRFGGTSLLAFRDTTSLSYQPSRKEILHDLPMTEAQNPAAGVMPMSEVASILKSLEGSRKALLGYFEECVAAFKRRSEAAASGQSPSAALRQGA